MKLGSKLPLFSLPGTDGEMHSPNDFKHKKAVVIIFACNHCPYMHIYANRIKQLIDDFTPQGVVFLGINSNDDGKYPADSFENMPAMSQILGFKELYLRDESQLVARLFKAERTPEVFLFGPDRTLVYKGGIDDNHEDQANVGIQYLKKAIMEVLQGKEIEIPETKAVGCTIKWK